MTRAADPDERRGPEPSSRNLYAFSTARLRVELPEPTDASLLYGLLSGVEGRKVIAGLLWDGPRDVAEIESWIERCRGESFADWGFHWVIRDASGELTGTAGRAMGAIGTRPLGVPGRADVGYWLGFPYWGRGVMSEALSALLQFGFDTLDYAKIEAEVFLNNQRGLRLVESVGMIREGVIRRAVRKRGSWLDEARYGVLPEEMPDREA